MTAVYTIYLVNQSPSAQTFWLFLAPPAEFANDPGVYASSSASQLVPPNNQGIQQLVIAALFAIGAGAFNQAVGPDVRLVSDLTQSVELGQGWLASYVSAPPLMGPTISQIGPTAPDQIAVATNAFNKDGNDNLHWFANQTFGLPTVTGLVGMTWSPEPDEVRQFTPTLTFLIASGEFSANTLVRWSEFANAAVQVSAPGSFDSGGDCTVTLLLNGAWRVAPGPPDSAAQL